jgi:4-amino-4-deoxy-L-arabinose transferase-like glycosyltransferase
MSKTRPLFYLLPVFLFIYLQFFHRLGLLGLVGPDEPRYAEVAKEMLISGDYITPRLSGRPWFEKPVLYYWVTALAYRVVGVSELAARLASALAGAAGVLIVCRLGRDWISARGGFLAALVLSTSVLYFSLARAASMDMLLTGALTAAWAGLYFSLFRTIKGNNLSDLWSKCSSKSAYLVYTFLGLSVLAKGPVGLALLASSFWLFILLTQQFQILRKIRLATGSLIFLGITVPWFWLCYRVNGYIFVDEFLVRHNIERFTSDRFQHIQPFWFYLAVLFAGFFPWIFQIVSPAGRFFRKGLRVNSVEQAKELFIWLWVLVPLLFFSFSRSKLPGYILPTAPAIALLVAREFEIFLTGNQTSHEKKWFERTAILQAAFICLLGLALPFTASRLNLQIASFVPQLASVLVGSGALGMFFLYCGQIRALIACYLVGIGLMVVLITHQIFPAIDHLESSRKLAIFLKQEGFANQPVYLFGLSRRVEYGLNFYLDTTTEIIYSVSDLKNSNGKEFFLITPFGFEPGTLLSHSEIRMQTSFDNQKILKLVPKQTSLILTKRKAGKG